MKRTHLIAALVGLLAVGLFAADAHAFYHPGMGVFTSRDPGAGGAMRIGAGGPAVAGGFLPRDPTGSDQYADGMNLYQYARSMPTVLVDPHGTMAGCSSKPPIKKPSCHCCCVKGLKFESWDKIESTTHWGHSIVTRIDLEFKEGGSQGLTDCDFKWYELVNLPTATGHAANTWTDMTSLPGAIASFYVWNSIRPAMLSLGIPDEMTLWDTDPASLGKRPGRNVERALYIAVHVSSGRSPECDNICANKELAIYGKQYLKMVNGAGTAASFGAVPKPAGAP